MEVQQHWHRADQTPKTYYDMLLPSPKESNEKHKSLSATNQNHCTKLLSYIKKKKKKL
jgi:hypothetical protein